MDEEQFLLPEDDNLEELLRQRLMAQQQQQQMGVGAGGAVGAGLAGFGALLAGRDPQAATQSVLNTSQQMQQNALRAKALESQATLGALRNISQERMRKEQMQNALDRIAEQNKFKQEEFDRRFPLESAEKARRAGIVAQSQQDLAKIRGDLQSQLAERGYEFKGTESAADRALREKLETEKLKQARDLKEKELGIKQQSVSQKGSGKGAKGVDVFGYEILDGAQPTDQDAKKVKQFSSGMQSANVAIDRIKDMVKKYGVRSLPFSEGRSMLSGATNQLVISAKEAANLGALAGPDMEIVLGMIGDPAGAKAAALGDEAYLRVIDTAQRLMNEKHAAEVRAYGFAPKTAFKSSGSTQKAGPDKQAVINEMRRRGLVK